MMFRVQIILRNGLLLYKFVYYVYTVKYNEVRAMKKMKPLSEFISENNSLSEAARILGHSQPNIFRWVNSDRKFYVKKVGKEFKVFEEK